MKKYNSIINRGIPPKLYHYTNNASVLNILSSKEIWATNIHYLNDSTEYKHAIGLLEGEINRRLFENDNGNEIAAYKRMLKEANMISSVNLATVSFSEVADDLSQWRGYSNGSGAAIGFESEKLKKIANAESFVLAPCVYSQDEHIALINEIIDDALPKYLAVENGGIHIIGRIIKYAPLIKNEKFKAEAEWRLTSGALSCSHKSYKFRSSLSMLIPYYAFPIQIDDELIVSELICGPTPHRDLAESAMKSLLLKLKTKAEVKLTEVPFRNW